MTRSFALLAASTLALMAASPALAGPGHAHGAQDADTQAAGLAPGAEPLLTGVRQLTFEGKRAGEGYFSADGSKLVFQSEREADNPFYQIYTLDLETGDTARVSPGHGKTTCAWFHPDGQKILYASTHEDPDARAEMAAEIAFRESGQTRRYSWDYDPFFDLYAFDGASGETVNLTNAMGYDAEGAYSPDGTKIAFASNRAAYAGTLSAEDQERLERDPAYFMDIYVMDADGSNVRQVTNTPGYDGGVFWSSDGTKLTWRRFSENGAQAEVFTANPDGSDAQQITQLGAMSWAPYFHPSGEYLVFATNINGFANFELYLVDAAGTREPVRVTNTDGFDGLAAFSPDGDTLSWTSNRTSDGSSQLFIAGWDHAGARALLGLDQEPPIEEASVQIEAAPTPVAVPTTRADIIEEDVRAHMAALTSPAMAGRLTGTPGEVLATGYVADVFATIGLEPAGDGATFFDAFDFTADVTLGEENMLAINTDDGGIPRAYPLGEAWTPLAFSSVGDVAPMGITFAGFGIQAPALPSAGPHGSAFDSYAGERVEGGWVLVFEGAPSQAEGDQRRHLTRFAEPRFKVSAAKAMGADGVIFAPAPNRDGEPGLPALTFDAASGGADLPVLAINGALRDAILTGEVPLDALNAGETSSPQTLSGIELAAAVDLEFKTRTGRNVVGRLASNYPDRAALVLGAHVDHLGDGRTSNSRATAEQVGMIHHGADDNASGVSALLEIAEKLHDDANSGRITLERDVIFAAWSGEELGLLGSEHFVREAIEAAGAEDLDPVVSAYLNMDMIGRLDGELQLLGLGSSSVWASEIERRNAVVGLPVTTSNDVYLPTDATPFYINKAPILSAFTGTHEDYHSPADTADRINFAGLTDIARFMGLVARSQATSAEEPDYIAVERQATGRGNAMARGGVFLGTVPKYGSDDVVGLAISGAINGGPADQAGLVADDVIVGLAGEEIADIYDYMRILTGLKPGEEVAIIVERGAERVELAITPGVRE